jgi:hypothetical protein
MTGISTSTGIATTIGMIITKVAAIGAAEFGSLFDLTSSPKPLASIFALGLPRVAVSTLTTRQALPLAGYLVFGL